MSATDWADLVDDIVRAAPAPTDNQVEAVAALYAGQSTR